VCHTIEWFMDIRNKGKMSDSTTILHNYLILYLVDQFLIVFLFIAHILIDLDCHNLNVRIMW
jgi:hypothetical protein